MLLAGDRHGQVTASMAIFQCLLSRTIILWLDWVQATVVFNHTITA